MRNPFQTTRKTEFFFSIYQLYRSDAIIIFFRLLIFLSIFLEWYRILVSQMRLY